MSFLKDFLNKDKYYKDTYEKRDYDEVYDIVIYLEKFMGIRLTRKLDRFKSKCWDVYFWFGFVNMSLAILCESISMVETAKGGTFEDAIKIFKMLPCTGTILLATAKSYKMARYRNVFENLIYEMRDMWQVGHIGIEERQLIASTLRYLNFVVKGFHLCNNLLLVIFMYSPFWEIIKRYTGHENKRILIYYYSVPFDPLQPVYYEVMLAIQTWHSFLGVWTNLIGDLLFVIFLSYLALQFDLLSMRIKKLLYVPIDDQLVQNYPLAIESVNYLENHRLTIETCFDWEDYYTKEIAEIILRHRALIRLARDVEDMFSFALLINFINSSMVLCFSGFCSVVVEKWNEIGYKSFLVTALSQIWIMCWYGQRLVDSTERVSDAVYSSGWYRAPKKIQSSLLIILLRSQKTLYVTTYGFSKISLASYSTIIKTAWSYFTLLLNTYTY